MRPDNPEIVDRLAAEYVLGTLRGRARRRFERWRETSPLVEERASFWEDRLLGLAKGTTPLTPPAHVWEGIYRRLVFGERAQRRGRMRAFALAAGVALALILGGLLYWRGIGSQPPTQVAAISASSGAPVWTVQIFAKTGRLTVRAGTLPSIPADRDYELWALPTGGAPVSLGVLPRSGVSQRTLTEAQQKALAMAPQVAVSIEPTGGSRTGQPTGAIVFVAPLRSFT
jgi:anti-sigma-K factor RskA